MESGKPSQPSSAEPEAAAAPSEDSAAAQGGTPSRPKSRLQVQEELEAANPRSRGFDPYNSGAFNIKDTWSRVNRKK